MGKRAKRPELLGKGLVHHADLLGDQGLDLGALGEGLVGGEGDAPPPRPVLDVFRVKLYKGGDKGPPVA